jgi:MFS family permease
MTESVAGAAAASDANVGTVSPSKVFWATWFGWMLDGFDSSMYSYILVGALTELLPASGIEATPANIGVYGGLLFSIFMLGWACSMVWGWAADRYGRVRIMCWTVLVSLSGTSGLPRGTDIIRSTRLVRWVPKAANQNVRMGVLRLLFFSPLARARRRPQTKPARRFLRFRTLK